MGLSLSATKRVKTTLSDSPEFSTACDSAFGHCLSLTEHAFRGVLPYQLPTASDHIHATLLRNHHPVILRWVPSPPTRAQVDSALRVVTRRRPKEKKAPEEEELVLGPAKFKEWAVVLFAEAAVGNAGREVLARVPIGVAGIVGIGAATRTGGNLVGAAIGVYALGVATSVYFATAVQSDWHAPSSFCMSPRSLPSMRLETAAAAAARDYYYWLPPPPAASPASPSMAAVFLMPWHWLHCLLHASLICLLPSSIDVPFQIPSWPPSIFFRHSCPLPQEVPLIGCQEYGLGVPAWIKQNRKSN